MIHPPPWNRYHKDSGERASTEAEDRDEDNHDESGFIRADLSVGPEYWGPELTTDEIAQWGANVKCRRDKANRNTNVLVLKTI